MKKYFKVLRSCPLFDRINDEDMITVLGCLDAQVARFDKNYTVFAEGTPARYIGILLSGSAQLVRVDYYGNRSILAEVEPLQLFAEAFACAEATSLPITVIAAEPCEVMLIDCRRLMHSCANSCAFHRQLIFNLMKGLATKNLLLHQKLEITSKRTTREKLMTYLMLQAKRAGSDRFEIPFDRQELADYLEVDRSGLSVEIGRLRREGILESHRKQFELLQPH